MSIDISGRDAKLETASVKICVTRDHPLVRLANALPWPTLIDLAVVDIKATTAKNFWWLGRKIRVRIHLGAYILGKLYDLTDRETEYGLKDNAAYQVFCGLGIVRGWHAPDHTKIEEFRSRLFPETQRQIANYMAKVAVHLGFGDAAETDFDSTVQEANIAYPTDASLLVKLSGLGAKLLNYLKRKTRGLLPAGGLAIDLAGIKKRARGYFFAPKSGGIDKRHAALRELHRYVKSEMRPLVGLCRQLDLQRFGKMPWNIRRCVATIGGESWRYLLDVAHFLRTRSIKAGKILSLHARAVACIKKGKAGKELEFGRVFQLGRIKGNFLFASRATSLRMADKQAMPALLSEHASLFGTGCLLSAAADKGYYSRGNIKSLKFGQVVEIGIEGPRTTKNDMGTVKGEALTRLKDRRAGIEPMIGHAKHGGQLGRSRMKSDTATLAAGYGSVLGLNLRQMIRHQAGKMKEVA